jgi:hypothetical protein
VCCLSTLLRAGAAVDALDADARTALHRVVADNAPSPTADCTTASQCVLVRGPFAAREPGCTVGCAAATLSRRGAADTRLTRTTPSEMSDFAATDFPLPI